MRNSTISSSIASVISHVIGSVASADVVRSFLALTTMREHMGCWQEQYQLGLAADSHQCYLATANLRPGEKPGKERLARPSAIFAQAVFATTPRFSTVRAPSQS